MHDPRIAPDLSTGEPRCSAGCPKRSKLYPTSTVFGPCEVTGRPPAQHGELCLPAIRAEHAELVQLRKRVAELESTPTARSGLTRVEPK